MQVDAVIIGKADGYLAECAAGAGILAQNDGAGIVPVDGGCCNGFTLIVEYANMVFG
jgi:hypothetical protein